MFRPVTCVSAMLFVGSCLYLYQSKHEAQLLDRQIQQTVHETENLREQTRALHAEFTVLRAPDRLRLFADQHLALRPVLPTQFTSMADLDSRLPAPRAPDPEPRPAPVVAELAQPSVETDAVASASVSPATDSGTTAVAESPALPIPPLPAHPPAMVAVAPSAAPARPAPQPEPARLADHRPTLKPPAPAGQPPLQAAIQTSPASAQGQTQTVASVSALGRVGGSHVSPTPEARPRPAVIASVAAVNSSAMQNVVARLPEPTVRAVESRYAAPVAPRPVAPASYAAPYAAPYPAPSGPPSGGYGGSLLGMAHGNVPMPMPRPTPIRAAQGSGPWQAGF